MPDATAHCDDTSTEHQGPGTEAAGQTNGATRQGLGRSDVIATIVLCLVTFALWIPRLGGPIDLRTDAAVYYVAGVAIGEGKGYTLTNEPGIALAEGKGHTQTNRPGIRAVQYPPLLPAFVAAHRRVVGTSDPQVLGHVLRVSYLVIALAYSVSAYAVVRQFLSPGYGFLAALITSLFLQTYFLSNSLFAEIPFALLSMLFILANRRSERIGPFILASLLAAAAFLVRTAGIALLAAWVGEALLQRRWRQFFARAIIAAVPFLGWQAYVNWVTSSPEYAQPAYEYQRAPYQYYNVPYADNVALIDPFQPEQGLITTTLLVRRLFDNLLWMPQTMGNCVSTVQGYFEWTLRDARTWFGAPPIPAWVARIAPTILGSLVLGGLALLAIRREWLLVLYALATVGLVCLTPWPVQFTRYLTPLTPILALAMLLFLDQLRHWLARRSPGVRVSTSDGASGQHENAREYAIVHGPQRVAWAGRWIGNCLVAIVVGGILLMQTYSLVRAYRSGWTHVPAELTRVGGGKLFFFDEKWQAYAEAVEWLRGRVQQGEVVAAATPQWAHVAGGFKSVMPPMEIDRIEAQRLLDTVPVRYAIVDDQDVGSIVSRYLAPAINAHPHRWRLVHEVVVPRKDDETQPPAKALIYERIQ